MLNKRKAAPEEQQMMNISKPLFPSRRQINGISSSLNRWPSRTNRNSLPIHHAAFNCLYFEEELLPQNDSIQYMEREGSSCSCGRLRELLSENTLSFWLICRIKFKDRNVRWFRSSASGGVCPAQLEALHISKINSGHGIRSWQASHYSVALPCHNGRAHVSTPSLHSCRGFTFACRF